MNKDIFIPKYIMNPKKKYDICKRCGHPILNRLRSSIFCLDCLSINAKEYQEKTKQRRLNRELYHLTCARCRHRWITRRKKMPKNCPNCNSIYWYNEIFSFTPEGAPQKNNKKSEDKKWKN